MRRIDIRWVLPDPTGDLPGPEVPTLRSRGCEVKRDLCRRREQALGERAKLVEAAIDRRREQQTRRTDEQARDRVEGRQSLERDARAALDRDEHRRRDERAA